MNNPTFSNIFPGEYLSYVTKYSERIQEILDNYEIAIFMARKAICFYEAMVINAVIIPTNCKVISSRVIDYNVISEFKGKKIAVIDDVVVKGESLKLVVSKLAEVHPDVLVVACDKDFLMTLKNFNDYNLSETYIALEKKDIYTFAGLITEYIEASMCPFNIDHPVYSIKSANSVLDKFLYESFSIDITSGIQKNYNISSRVIYFGFNVITDAEHKALEVLKKSIIKIRILTNANKTTLIPFVLFPEVSNAQLEDLFAIIVTGIISTHIKVGNDLIEQENKMKLISYFFSEILAMWFLKSSGLEFQKQNKYDDYQFFYSTSLLFEDVLNDFYIQHQSVLEKIFILPVIYDKFNFTNILSDCYQMISNIDPTEQIFSNSYNIAIKQEIIITLSMLCECLPPDAPYIIQIASCVIDVLIDRGIIVPSIVHTPNGIIRAYKMGEYSKLTRTQIESFAVMLCEYQQMINDGLGKTEFEKLCVLFFRMAQNRGIFAQQEKYEDGCYSICYSLYGPRVSASNVSYKINSNSALITDFCNPIENRKALIILQYGKYIIQPINTVIKIKNYTSAFAYQYSSLQKVFKSIREDQIEKKSDTSIWNQHIHTYVQYLTLRAIGNSKKNQFLSLCAELFQIISLPNDFFAFHKKNKEMADRILSGVNSGIWKYWCYQNDAYNKTTQQIFEKDMQAGALLLYDQEPVSDLKSDWELAIRKAGELLYYTAFFINEVIIAIHAFEKINMYDDVINIDRSSDSSIQKTIFTLGSYYNKDKEIEDLRHKVEKNVQEYAQRLDFIACCENELMHIKNEAMLQLDLCDLVLENNIPSYKFFESTLIIFSKTGDFPKNFSPYLNELMLEGINERTKVKVFGFENSNEITNKLNMTFRNLDNEKYSSLRYFIIDLKDPCFGTYQIGKGVRGSNLALKINEIVSRFDQEESPHSGEVYFIKSTADRNPLQIDKELVQSTPKNSASLSSLVSALNNIFSQNCFTQTPSVYHLHLHAKNITVIGKQEVSKNLKQMGDNYGQVISPDQGDAVCTVNFAADGNRLITELKQIMARADEENKQVIQEAISAASIKDESKFIQALRKAGSFISSVASKVTASLLFEYMKQHGMTL